MFFSVRLLHIDEHVFYDQEQEDAYQENLKRLEALSEATKLKLDILKIENELGYDASQCKELLKINDNKGSCREDVISMLRNRVIYKYVKNNKLTKIMLGDNGLRVSIQSRLNLNSRRLLMPSIA